MFTELFGLPAHALIVHAAVVFIPLAVAAAVLYAVVPVLRQYLWWVVLALGVVAPLSAWAAVLSGDQYKAYWVNHGAAGDFLAQINTHESWARPTAWLTTALGVVMLAMVLVTIPAPVRLGPLGAAAPAAARSSAARWVTAVVTVVLALVTLYYVIRTGDAGAHATHPEL
jgi:hypothetical protein